MDRWYRLICDRTSHISPFSTAKLGTHSNQAYRLLKPQNSSDEINCFFQGLLYVLFWGEIFNSWKLYGLSLMLFLALAVVITLKVWRVTKLGVRFLRNAVIVQISPLCKRYLNNVPQRRHAVILFPAALGKNTTTVFHLAIIALIANGRHTDCYLWFALKLNCDSVYFLKFYKWLFGIVNIYGVSISWTSLNDLC